MRIKKVLSSIIVTVVLIISMCSTVFAESCVDVAGEKSSGGVPIPATVSVNKNLQTPTPRALSNPGVYQVEVYPADSVKQVYYTDMYTTMNGNGGQWANGTLGTKTTALYREKNCDSVYVIAAYYTGAKRYYKLLSNDVVVDEGFVSPNSSYSLEVLVNIKPNSQNLDRGQWRLKLHEGNITNSWDLWGVIYLPTE